MNKVLLADDSRVVRQAAQMVLHKNPNLELVLAESADELLSKAHTAMPQIIVCDHTLSGKTVYELAALLKADEQTKQIPILALISDRVPFDPARAKEAGVSDFLRKPFESATFIHELQLKLQKAGQPSPAIPEALAPLPTTTPTPVSTPVPVLAPIPPPVPTPKPAQIHTATALPAGSIDREELMAMIRQSIEEVVWEVVPQLAETIIREEIDRLIKE